MATSYSCYTLTILIKPKTPTYCFISSEFFHTQERFLYQKKAYFINFILMCSKDPQDQARDQPARIPQHMYYKSYFKKELAGLRVKVRMSLYLLFIGQLAKLSTILVCFMTSSILQMHLQEQGESQSGGFLQFQKLDTAKWPTNISLCSDYHKMILKKQQLISLQ